MKKKVLLINFWQREGGMSHYSEALINKIYGKYQIVYLSTYKSRIKGIKNIQMEINLNPLKNVSKIIKQIHNIHPDIIHFTSSHPANFFLYQKLKDYRTVLTIHDVKMHEGERFVKKVFNNFHLKIISKYVKNIIVHSTSIKKELPKYFKNKKIWVMPHSDYSHLAYAKKNTRRYKKFAILFFGRILEYKGLNYLIKAFNQLPSDNYQLIIAGKGKINCKIPKDKNIKVINRLITNKEMQETFSKTDITVLPYISASQSGVAYLSLAFEKPVIATKVGALPEVVNSKNGILINPKSADGIKNAIEKISVKTNYNKLVRNIKENKLNNKKEILSIINEVYNGSE